MCRPVVGAGRWSPDWFDDSLCLKTISRRIVSAPPSKRPAVVSHRTRCSAAHDRRGRPVARVNRPHPRIIKSVSYLRPIPRMAIRPGTAEPLAGNYNECAHCRRYRQGTPTPTNRTPARSVSTIGKFNPHRVPDTYVFNSIDDSPLPRHHRTDISRGVRASTRGDCSVLTATVSSLIGNTPG